MRKFLIWALVLCGIMLGACTSEDDAAGDGESGSIYGIVTELGTAEPMRSVGVELYKFTATSTYNGERFYTEKALLLKTVTFDDGHFEFQDLSPRDYVLQIVADGYEQVNEGYVNVESGRQARIDLQVKKVNTYLSVYTEDAVISGNNVTLKGKFSTKTDYNSSLYPSEVGFMYSTHSDPKNGGIQIKGETGTQFSAKLNGLAKGTYYVQAYATNSIGKTYGEVRSFTISGYPAVSTLSVSNISETSATLNAHIDYVGEHAYTERGFVYSYTFPTPTIDDDPSVTGRIKVSGEGLDYSANVANLSKDKIYYYRAYVKNEEGIWYGKTLSFSTDLSGYVIVESIAIQKQDLGYCYLGAAQTMCEASRIGGFSDWRLPSVSELSIIYNHREEIGGFKKDYYWSSTRDFWYYYVFNFSNGGQGTYSRSDVNCNVRAVRSIK